MALQRMTLRLTELRCLAQTESGGSEPYLWATFFAFGARQLPFQAGLLGVVTPATDSFRSEFPNDLKSGRAVSIPPLIGSASFELDLDSAPQPKLVGCVVVLMEEDATPHASIVDGHIAYAKAIEEHLNALAKKRWETGNFGPITSEEIAAVAGPVREKVIDAIGRDQWNPFRNQDDAIGIAYKTFVHPVTDPASEAPIAVGYFDLPEVTNKVPNVIWPRKWDRFQVSGSLSFGPASPNPTVDLCAGPRAAVSAKLGEVRALQQRLDELRNEWRDALPAEKADLEADMREVERLRAEANALLPNLRAALNRCIEDHHPQDGASNVGGAVEPA